MKQRKERVPKNKPREAYEGAKPLKYHSGALYYRKNELLDEATLKRVPSAQQSKLKLPKLDVPAIIEGARAANKEATSA